MTKGLPSLDRRSVVAGLVLSPVARAMASTISGSEIEKMISAFIRARDEVDALGERLVDLESQWGEEGRDGPDKSIQTGHGVRYDRDIGEAEIIDLTSRHYERMKLDAKRLGLAPETLEPVLAELSSKEASDRALIHDAMTARREEREAYGLAALESAHEAAKAAESEALMAILRYPAQGPEAAVKKAFLKSAPYSHASILDVIADMDGGLEALIDAISPDLSA